MGIVLPEGVFNNPSLRYVREFVEDRAFIKAVVSLPQEAFVSSGAGVKASLLFLQKFTEEEKQQFDETYNKAKAEIKAKYSDEIAAETERLEKTILKSRNDKKVETRKENQMLLRDYLKRMNEKMARESRQLLKNYLDYSIFVYEAEKVGISASGEDDQNELYPNDKQPEFIEKTCLELYKSFLDDNRLVSVLIRDD